MKKEIKIPNYKEVSKSNNETYSYLAVLLIATAVLFAGVSLPGLTGYDVYENFPVGVSTAANRQADPLLNRGSNAVTEMEINPERVIAGGTAYITVDPGSECSWQRMKIYYWGASADSFKQCGQGVMKDDNVKMFSSRDVAATQRGGFEVCQTKTIPYSTSASWSEGVYAVAVFDYQANVWICEPFYIYRLNERSEDVASWSGSSLLDQLDRR